MLPFLANINWPSLMLHLLLSAAVAFVVFGTCVLILILVQRLSRLDFSRKHIVRITNGGNVRSIYHLLVEAPEGALQFKLLQNNIPLGEIPIPVDEPLVEQPTEMTPAGSEPPKKPKPAAAGGAKSNGTKNAADEASKAGKGVAEKAGALASLMGTIGGMLPGKAGAALKEQGDIARGVQTKTTQTMQMPETTMNKVDVIQKDLGKLGVKPTTISPPGKGNGSRPVSVAEPVEDRQNSDSKPRVVKPAFVKTKSSGCYVETKEVAPGENLELTLWIAPLSRRSPEKSFTYTVKSQQIPLEKCDKEAPQIVSRGVVQFKAVAPWRYWLPSVLNGSIILMETLSLVYFLTLIW